ncbi:hypothetical protein U6G28_07660 [Actinomycetaceae bacterium MB13-C1-2]|nr:hypothetical protein U6G28_07660 [Actinomycetaceae bacterium MB13-C1-2]
MIHRRAKTQAPWWHSAVICDFPGAFSNDDLKRAARLLPDVAELGFDAVLIRPASPRVDVGAKSLPSFVEKAHDQGLKVVVRAFLTDDEADLRPESSPPQLTLEHDVSELHRRARAILATNADGVDLGLVNDEAGSPDSAANARAFTEAVQGQLAEVELAGGTTILAAAIPSQPREAALRHLTEEWFHHLRDDSLVATPWDAHEIKQRVSLAYADRDPLGHTAAWRYSLPKWTDSPYARNSADYGWAKSSKSDQREMAMMLYAASLPGSVYVPFLHVGGGVTVKDGAAPRLKLSFEKGRQAKSQATLTKEALLVRKKHALGDATLAFLDGPGYCDTKTAVHLSGDVLVVLNTGKADVIIPAENRPLVMSGDLRLTPDGETVVRPNSCAWFLPPTPEPAGPLAYR